MMNNKIRTVISTMSSRKFLDKGVKLQNIDAFLKPYKNT